MQKGITVHFESEEDYRRIVADASEFRKHLAAFFAESPELKPDWFDDGYVFQRTYRSVKLPFAFRQIKPKRKGERIVTVRPSFLLPYNVMRTKVAQAILTLSLSGASYEAIIGALGDILPSQGEPKLTEEKITRIIRSLGKSDIVRTTVKDPTKLSESVSVDEKHTKQRGQKAYIGMIAASGVILGAMLLPSCSADALTHGYGMIGAELSGLSGYSVSAVTCDGFRSTQIAMSRVFPDADLYRCFFHSWLPLRDRFSSNPCFKEASDKLWNLFRAKTQRELGQRARRLREYAESTKVKGLKKILKKACKRVAEFAYEFIDPDVRRTTSEVDRLMRPVTRFLSRRGNLRGRAEHDILLVRGLVLILNFKHYTERSQRKKEGKVSPFQSLNGRAYSDSWLENLLICRVA